MGGYCQGSPLNATQSSCSQNGGQWLADPSTESNSTNSGVGGGPNLSEIFGSIGSILGPLGNFGANMYAVSQGQPQVAHSPVVVGANGVPGAVDNTARTNQMGNSNMIWWIGGVVLLLIIVAVIIMVMKRKQD